MSALKVITKEGMIEHVEQIEIENEPANILGGSDTPRSGASRNTGRAFGKSGNVHGESDRSNRASEIIGDRNLSGSDRPITIPDGGNENRTVEPNRDIEPSAGSISGSGSNESRSGGNRYGIEPRRADETANEYSKRYKREYRLAVKRAESGQSERDIEQHQETHLVEEGNEESGFSLTVEDAPIVAGESLEIIPAKRTEKAAPRAKRGSKYKEPAKDAVQFTASMLKDMYGFSDGLLMLVSTLLNKYYVPGTMELDDEKAEKISHALVRMNSSLPQLAEKINKFSAPMTLVSVLVPDLLMKGMMVRGQWATKQPPKINS